MDCTCPHDHDDKSCSIPGCDKPGKHIAKAPWTGRWCGMHYYRHKEHGDPEAPVRSYVKGGATPKCGVPGCKREGKVRAKDGSDGHWCWSHNKKWDRYGDLNWDRATAKGNLCHIDGCDKEAWGAAPEGWEGYWCQMHLARHKRNGTPDLQPRKKVERGTCHIDGCDREAKHLAQEPWTGRWCETHYQRWFKHKDPLFEWEAERSISSRNIPCSVEGCNRPARVNAADGSGGYWCGACAAAHNRYGTTDRLRAGEKPMCKVDGCPDHAASLGWCMRHYASNRYHGDPLEVDRRAAAREAAKAERKECRVPDCTASPKYSDGYCGKHHERVVRWGDPNFTKREIDSPLVGDGQKRCSGCREVLSLDEFHRSANGAGGRTSRCKRCSSSQRMMETYGLSVEGFEEILDAQGGGCAGCGRIEEDDGRRLAIDHVHRNSPSYDEEFWGDVRGILCGRCNIVLGNALDNPDVLMNLVEYLIRHIESEQPSRKIAVEETLNARRARAQRIHGWRRKKSA